MNYSYLAHHGVKGQKWGVRRYQNQDGSLTDEGRRRYGYGSAGSDVITKNTAQRIIQGAKLGGKIGTGLGVAGGALAAGNIMSLNAAALAAGAAAPFGPAGAAVAAGTTFAYAVMSGLANGALYGGATGAVVGAVETHRGRQYIERYDSGLSDFEHRELSARQAKR